MLTSPGCWATFGELLARHRADPAHQLAADAYAVSHPGVPERRAIQSVAVHLMILHLVIERGADPAKRSKLLGRMTGRPAFHWLEPPTFHGRMTAADVLESDDPGEHLVLIREWARDVWMAWSPHHATVRDWVRRSLGSPA